MQRVAWIVGGAKGLGVMVARQLVAEGYKVVISYRHSSAAAERLQATLGAQATIIQGDNSSAEDVRRMCGQVLQYGNRIDVLVVMAGPFIFEATPLAELTGESWREMIDGNLSSAYYLIKEVVPVMQAQQYGRIITFGYAGVEQGMAWPGFAAYAAAKAGLHALTISLAQEVASQGITVNMISPGDIRQPYKEQPISDSISNSAVPVGRMGTGGDIARAVSFLAHPDASYITGISLPVTGGLTSVRKRENNL